MNNWLTLWGETSRPGFAFKSILVELAKDGARDYVRDFFKDRAAEAVAYDRAVQVATGQALTEFLYLVQQELEDADFNEGELEEYALPLMELIRDKSVAALLGSAFEADCSVLDAALLAKTWERLGLLSLPEELSWQRVAKRYLKKVKAIARESAELREILDSPAPDPRDVAATGWREYRQWLQKQYGNLRLDSLDTSGAAYNQLRLWRIFIPQSVEDMTQSSDDLPKGPKEMQRRLAARNQLEEEPSLEIEEYPAFDYGRQPAFDYGRQRTQQTRSVLEAIGTEADPYLVIVGLPGSGKTTLLQYRALQWSEDSEAVPILIELRLYKDKQNLDFLEFFIQQAGKDCHLELRQIQERLASGRALLLFDGLDEVFNPEQRQEIVGEIIRFTKTYPQVRTIVTSRVVGYDPSQNQKRLREEGFRHLMLQDLEPAQVEDFIQRWHELTFDDPIDKEKKRERLKRAIEDSEAIRLLAGNPLLLTMMAILNRNQELPRDRAELYNQASRLLLHQWDMERTLRDARLASVTIDYQDKQAMLRKVAYFMQANSRGLVGNSIARADLERILTEYLQTILSQSSSPNPQQIAELVLDNLRTRNFILCFLGGDYYGFIHRTFLEFFCAWDFVWQFEKEQRFQSKQLIHKTFGKHWQDKSWHEVLRLIAGMLDPKFVGEAIEYLMSQESEEEDFINLFLAAECLTEVRNRHYIQNVDAGLLEKIQGLLEYGSYKGSSFYILYPYNSVAEIRSKAVALLSTAWKSNADTLQKLKERLIEDYHPSVRKAAVKAIVANEQNDLKTLEIIKSHAMKDDSSEVRTAAVEALANGWKDNSDTLPLLKLHAVEDYGWDVRMAAMQALLSSWRDETDTLKIIKSRATKDYDSDVRTEAIQALVKWWKNDSDTLKIIKSRAKKDYDSNVRIAAIQALIASWKNDSDTLNIIKSRAKKDYDSNVQIAAIQALANSWKDDPDTLEIIKDLVAREDNNSAVCISAIENLSIISRDEPDTLRTIKSFARNHSNYDLQVAALKILTMTWKDDPDAFIITKSLVKHDNYLVRDKVIKILYNHWLNSHDTFAILKYSAKEDDSSEVRNTALKALAKNWAEETEVLEIIKSRAQDDDNWEVRSTALQSLSKVWQHDTDDTDMFDFLRGCALNDPFNSGSMLLFGSKNPRQVALELIVEQYPDRPQTLELLSDRVKNDEDKQVRTFAKNTLQAIDWAEDEVGSG